MGKCRALLAYILFIFSTVFTPSLSAQKETAFSRGRLILQITSPRSSVEKVTRALADPEVCGSEIRRQKLSIDPTTHGVKDVIVWLSGSKNLEMVLPQPPAPQPVILEIEKCEFKPKILFVSPDQKIDIRSKDPHLYNLRTISKKNPSFYRAFPPNLNSLEWSFSKPEIVSLTCDIHPWMNAFVVVKNHPYFEKTTENGWLEMKELLYGTYRINLWHETLGYGQWDKSVTINNRENTIRIEWDPD